MLLRPRPPFDFSATLRFVLSPPALVNGRSFPPLLDYFQDGEYRRVIDVGGRHVLYGVSESRSANATALRIRILAGPDSAAIRQAIRSAVARQFSTELDLEPFHSMVKTECVLASIANRFRGLRIPQALSTYECVVSSILEQQVNFTFAYQVKSALIQTYGAAVNFQGQKYRAFPEPSVLASVTPHELRALQISGPKARYIIGVSQATAAGSADFEKLRLLPAALAQASLLEHKGVGPWTAGYVGLRALGHLDCLPSSEVGLQKAIQYFYRLRQQPAASRVEHLAKKWAGWRSYATFYLWMTLWEGPEWKKGLLDEIYPAG